MGTDYTPALVLSGIHVTFGRSEVLSRLKLSVLAGQFVTLLGPSGCGKTTLLKVISGLHREHMGRVWLFGNDVTDLPPYSRNVGVVFQNYALFPHLSVFENVAFGVRLRPDMVPRLRELVGEALDLVHLSAMADRPVTALSGGQQQRVALARSLVVRPAILLLDEPFSALDRQLREEMQIELRQILRNRAMTAIFVTHDQEEAVVLSDRIVVMREGEIEQEGRPEELYDTPRTIFVSDFIGKSTKLAGEVVGQSGSGSVVKTWFGEVTVPKSFHQGSPVWVVVRSDRIVAKPPTLPCQEGNRLAGAQLLDIINHGATRLLILQGGTDDRVSVQMLGMQIAGLSIGSPCSLEWRVEDTLCFPREVAS